MVIKYVNIQIIGYLSTSLHKYNNYLHEAHGLIW